MGQEYGYILEKQDSWLGRGISLGHKIFYTVGYGATVLFGAKAFYDFFIEKDPALALEDAKTATITFFSSGYVHYRENSKQEAKEELREIEKRLRKANPNVNMTKTIKSALKDTSPLDVVRPRIVKATNKLKNKILERDHIVSDVKRFTENEYGKEIDISEKTKDRIVYTPDDGYEQVKAQITVAKDIEKYIQNITNVKEKDPLARDVLENLVNDSLIGCICGIVGIERENDLIVDVSRLASKIHIDKEAREDAKDCIDYYEETGEVPIEEIV